VVASVCVVSSILANKHTRILSNICPSSYPCKWM